VADQNLKLKTQNQDNTTVPFGKVSCEFTGEHVPAHDQMIRHRSVIVIAVTGMTCLSAILARLDPRHFRSLSFMAPDSASYLEWNIARTPLYPFVLSVVRASTPDLSLLGPLQFAAFAVAVALLVREALFLWDNVATALLIGLSLLLNPQLVSYAFTVIPDSLFMSAVAVHVALVSAALRRGRPEPFLGAGICAAIAMLLKPVGFAVIPCLAVPVALSQQRRWSVASALAGPIAAGVLFVSAWNFVAHGVFATQTQGGYTFISYVAPLLDPADSLEFKDVAAGIARGARPIARDLAAIESLDARVLVFAEVHDSVEVLVRRELFAGVERRLGRPITDRRAFTSDREASVEMNRIGGTLARAAVLTHPGAFARQVADQLYALWGQPLIRNRATFDDFRSRLDVELSRTSSIGRPAMMFRVVSPPVYWAAQVWLWGTLVASVVAIGAVLVWRGDRQWQTLAYASLIVQADFLLVACVQAGLPRYALAMWPLAAFVFFGTMARIAGRARLRMRRRGQVTASTGGPWS
jgi:dolichyl-phosphate-mannose-protein mannosyltransferase